MAGTKSLGTVSTTDVAITATTVCDSIIVCEAGQAGTTSYQFRGKTSTDYITKPSGAKLELVRAKGFWNVGDTVGYIKRVDADATFDQLELP